MSATSGGGEPAIDPAGAGTDDADGDRHAGGCQCGGVRWLSSGPLRPVSDCHCEPCRRFSGHHMAATATDIANLTFLTTDTLTWYESAPDVQYGFCSTCGSSLFWRSADEPWHLSITAGSIDPPTGLRTDTALFMDEHGDYHQPQPVDEAFPGDRPRP
ncbi:MAG: GFA family protein [Acidimicrobiales bacterium]